MSISHFVTLIVSGAVLSCIATFITSYNTAEGSEVFQMCRHDCSNNNCKKLILVEVENCHCSAEHHT